MEMHPSTPPSPPQHVTTNVQYSILYSKYQEIAQFFCAVLADYMALTSREIDLNEDEVVELIKVGCAGWWYVRITTLYPYPEGWAPSTYLAKNDDVKKHKYLQHEYSILLSDTSLFETTKIMKKNKS